MMPGPVVDFHAHYTPPAILRSKTRSSGGRSVERVDGVPLYTHHAGLSDLDTRIAAMNEGGIDAAYLSSAAGLEGDIDVCRAVNDGLAEVAAEHPGRLFGLAHVPPLGGDEALAELARACRELGHRGAAVASTVDGRPLDDPAFEPFFEAVAEHAEFLFVHPPLIGTSIGFAAFDRYDLFRMVGREFELQLAVLRLIIGGVLDRHPDLKVVMSHLGGGIAATWGRVQRYQDKEFWGLEGDEVHGRVPERPIDEYLSRMFFDTGGFFGAETSLRTALVTIPSDRLVLGSDYPQELRTGEDLKALTDTVRRLGDDTGARILYANAQSILATG